jgi:hypothetical protein
VNDAAVRAFVYDRTLKTGRIPLVADVSAGMNAADSDVRESLARLADAHMLVLQGNGEILMAMPFSAVPTTFLVRADNVETFTSCVWDGLGALVMMKKDGVVETGCGCCNAALTLQVKGGELAASDAIVHFGVPVRHWWDDVVFA